MSDLTFTIRLQGADAGGSAAVAKVVALVKQLGLESATAGAKAKQMGGGLREAASGASGLEGAAKTLRSLLSALGVAVILHKFEQLALEQIHLASAMGDLAEATGVATAPLSVFKHVADQAQVSTEELGKGFRFLAQAQQDARDPTNKVRDALHALGIDAVAFAKLPLDQAMLRVANAAARFQASGQKLTAIGEILGPRFAAQAIPFLQKLAGDGFGKARDEAEKLGLVVSDLEARKAQDFIDAMARLKGAAGGLAREFALGLAPSIIQFADAAGEAGAKSDNFARRLGEGLGIVAKGLVLLFNTVSAVIVAALREAGNVFETIGGALGAVAAGDFKEAGAVVKQGLANVKNIIVDAKHDIAGTFRDFFPDAATLERQRTIVVHQIEKLEAEIAKATKGKVQHKPSEIIGMDLEELKVFKSQLQGELSRLVVDLPGDDPTKRQKALQARIDLQVQAAKDEADIAKAGLEVQQAQADEAYRQGLTSAQAFFDERSRIIRDAAQADITSLQKQGEALQHLPVLTPEDAAKRAQAIAKVNDDIAKRTAERDRDLAKNQGERAAAQEALAKERLAFEQRVLDLQGQQTAAAIAGIRAERSERERSLVKGGLTPQEASARAQAREDLEIAAAQFEGLQRQVDLVFNEVTRREDQIRSAVAANVIGQTQGERQIAALRRGQIPILEELRRALLASADSIKDPAALQALQSLVDKIDAFRQGAVAATGAMAEFKKGLVGVTAEVVTSELQQLGSIIEGTADDIHSLGDAFRAFALIAIHAIEQVIAQMIALRAQEALSKLLLNVGGAAAGGGAGNPFAGVAPGFAAGGLVRGPSHAGGGRLIEVEGDEYIFPKVAVRRVGVDFFAQLHRLLLGGGRILPARTPRGRYAEGGQVILGAARINAGGTKIQLELTLEEGIVAKQIKGREGQAAVVHVIGSRSRNRRTARGSARPPVAGPTR